MPGLSLRGTSVYAFLGRWCHALMSVSGTAVSGIEILHGTLPPWRPETMLRTAHQGASVSAERTASA